MSAPSPYDDVVFPPLHTLPFRAGDPPGAIWGFYEHLSGSSQPDELGSINLLTPARILRASQNEIKVGRVCGLNWPLHKPHPPAFGRAGLTHRMSKMEAVDIGFSLDEELAFNSQAGSQWDSLKHWSHQETRQFYNGLHVQVVVDERNVPVAQAFDAPQRNGIHSFQGKLVGRGVLLDYFSYAHEHGIVYSPDKFHAVTAQDLDACALWHNVNLEQGDILFVRMGFIAWYDGQPKEARDLDKLDGFVGVGQSADEIQWLWDHHFAAVASDTPILEALPNAHKLGLHDYLLALWGTPIGELFDLEELSRICKELKRWSFFVTSSPLNVVNAIASPPNALAIF